MNKRKSPIEKEWAIQNKREQYYLKKHSENKDSKLNLLLKDKVPESLQQTLDKAFFKAFQTIFTKGTGIIEKTYKRSELEEDYRISEYASSIKHDRKSLLTFSENAKSSERKNLLLSGVSGIGLGVLGIGIPDIVIFTGLILKNIYEICLNYGFDYDSENEKRFILLLIEGSLSSGGDLNTINEEINHYIEFESFAHAGDINSCIESTSDRLSKELLYMKFLQGIPIVGAVGGTYDVVYMNRITKYAELKYRRRFYRKQLNQT